MDAFAELVSLAVAKDPRLAAAGAQALAGANSRGAAASAAGGSAAMRLLPNWCIGCAPRYSSTSSANFHRDFRPCMAIEMLRQLVWSCKRCASGKGVIWRPMAACTSALA